MNKSVLYLSLLFSTAVISTTATAANTITFVGEITDTTCNISVNGNSGDTTVQLPTVTLTDFSGAGSSTSEKEFSFEVSGCTAGTQNQVGLRFITPAVSTAGNLKNIASTNAAGDVDIQILEGSTAFNFNQGEVKSSKKTISGSSALAFPFKARYFTAGGSPTVGIVEAKLEYALSYN